MSGLFDDIDFEGKTVVVKTGTLEEALEHMKKMFSCRDCGGPMDYQYYKEEKITISGYTSRNMVHDYYMCKECDKGK
jgi:hypothetical protein